MKSILAIIALSLLLTGCTTRTSDSAIRREVVGVWTLASAPGKVIVNKPDGTILVRIEGVETLRGRWQVKDGYIIEGIGSSTVESNKVLRVSGDEMVVLSIDGHTPLTLHRGASLTADQAKTLAMRLANEKTFTLYHCQPFIDGQPARIAGGRWVWIARQGFGHGDIEARVDLAEDGSTNNVYLRLLNSQDIPQSGSSRMGATP